MANAPHFQQMFQNTQRMELYITPQIRAWPWKDLPASPQTEAIPFPKGNAYNTPDKLRRLLASLTPPFITEAQQSLIQEAALGIGFVQVSENAFLDADLLTVLSKLFNVNVYLFYRLVNGWNGWQNKSACNNEHSVYLHFENAHFQYYDAAPNFDSATIEALIGKAAPPVAGLTLTDVAHDGHCGYHAFIDAMTAAALPLLPSDGAEDCL